MRDTLLACVVLFVATAAAAQPTFEVASVKLNTSGSNQAHTSVEHGRLSVVNSTLWRLIASAYDMQESALVGPDWMRSTRFDIEAKPPAGTTEDATQPMLKALLEERFKLTVHKETRTVTAFTLTVAKGGLKIKEVEPGSDGSDTGGDHFSGTKVSIQQLANYLARVLKAPVVDKTETKAVYDIKLKFVPETRQANPVEAQNDDAAAGPSVFTALQESLGLKLQSQKVPAEVLVIDHIERIPTEN